MPTRSSPHPQIVRAGLARAGLAAAAALAALPLHAARVDAQSRPVAGRQGPPCAEGNDGLAVPEGFCARAVARNLGPVRQLAVGPDGTLYASLSGGSAQAGKSDVTGGVLAFRDADGDGRVDARAAFGAGPGNGLAVHDGWLYFAQRDHVVRWRLAPGRLEPVGNAETIVRDLPAGGDHYAKSIALAGDTLYVGLGSASNSCQEENRLPGSKGVDPCPELAVRAGVWRFSASRRDQRQADGRRVATGLRNPSALAVRPGTGELWAAVNGRDMLSQDWGFSDEVNAQNPGEELALVRQGQDYGWPYCYWSVQYRAKVLAPDYGGDGRTPGRCARAAAPAYVFPAHWAPLAMTFYDGAAFGLDYHGGVLVAFHGSWNRAPLDQEKGRVVLLPFRDGRPAGPYVTLASIADGRARLRSAGVAVAPDGSVYVAAENSGTIWRIWKR